MKKNKMMRIASVLLVATLLSTCVISGTFAKYVTSGDAKDKARVAKFGVEVTGTSDLFATQYVNHDVVGAAAAGTYLSVIHDDTADDMGLVAPGTDGSLTNFALSGTPEVAVRVTFTVDKFELANWAIDTEFYCPLFITVNDTTLSGLDYTSADDFEAAVKALIEATTHDYAANTNLADSSVTADGLAISWKWFFTGATGIENSQTDVKDTYLGDRAAEGAAATIDFAVTCTVTQID